MRFDVAFLIERSNVPVQSNRVSRRRLAMTRDVAWAADEVDRPSDHEQEAGADIGSSVMSAHRHCRRQRRCGCSGSWRDGFYARPHGPWYLTVRTETTGRRSLGDGSRRGGLSAGIPDPGSTPAVQTANLTEGTWCSHRRRAVEHSHVVCPVSKAQPRIF